MNSIHIDLTTHLLPFWFLVVSLFIPRIALLVAWLQQQLTPFHLTGIVPLLGAIFVPRILILVLIYQDQGLSAWFLIHAVALLLVWGGTGGNQMRRRRYRDD